MATYPSTLPLPQSTGYQITPVEQSIRTDMEFGAARARRRTLARNDKLKFTWMFTDAQLTTFRTWHENPAESAGGAAWFSCNLAIGTGGVVTCEARIIGGLTISELGGLNWSVAAEVEVR